MTRQDHIDSGIGCLAQIVNVIAPLFTNKDSILRQTIFYPYAWSLAHGRGTVLDLRVESETYEISRTYRSNYGNRPTERTESVPVLDVAATHDSKSGNCAFFLLNRDLEKECEVILEWQGTAPARVLEFETLTGKDLKAANSFEQPERIKAETLEAPCVGSRMAIKLPPRSFSVLRTALS